MKRISLDKEFDKWSIENEEDLKEIFLESNNFHEYLDECWQEYQKENNLIDESNETNY